jgi:hypothetical protein
MGNWRIESLFFAPQAILGSMNDCYRIVLQRSEVEIATLRVFSKAGGSCRLQIGPRGRVKKVVSGK